jgi:hypothetical protein
MSLQGYEIMEMLPFLCNVIEIARADRVNKTYMW